MTFSNPPMHAPVALSIAGSDSSGGAGIQADLRAFSFFDVYGTTAVTAVTAQSPSQVTRVEPVSPDAVQAQIETVFEALTIGAVKTGMLHSSATVDAVHRVISRYNPPLVVDPVLKAQSGAQLLEEKAVSPLSERLFSCAVLLTPNIDETEAIMQRSINTPDDMASAASHLSRRYNTAVLVKGGHAEDAEKAEDILCTEGDNIWRLQSPRVATETRHGTGCAFSAALTAGLAKNLDLQTALTWAKAYVLGSLGSCVKIGPDAYGLYEPADLPLSDIACVPFGEEQKG